MILRTESSRRLIICDDAFDDTTAQLTFDSAEDLRWTSRGHRHRAERDSLRQGQGHYLASRP
jgi:hypothetical protein